MDEEKEDRYKELRKLIRATPSADIPSTILDWMNQKDIPIPTALDATMKQSHWKPYPPMWRIRISSNLPPENAFSCTYSFT
jgi:hypothetical protein